MSEHRRIPGVRLLKVARPRVPILFYAHPFELAFGFVLFVSGIRAFVSGESSAAINNALPEAALIAFQIVSFLAGSAVISGLLLRDKPFGRTLERIGCLLASGAYTGYAVILGTTLPLNLAWSTLTMVLAVASAFWFRAKAIRKTELTILRTLRAANANDPDLIRRLVDSRAIDGSKEERP